MYIFVFFIMLISTILTLLVQKELEFLFTKRKTQLLLHILNLMVISFVTTITFIVFIKGITTSVLIDFYTTYFVIIISEVALYIPLALLFIFWSKENKKYVVDRESKNILYIKTKYLKKETD